jgi:hypothetical protein
MELMDRQDSGMLPVKKTVRHTNRSTPKIGGWKTDKQDLFWVVYGNTRRRDWVWTART